MLKRMNSERWRSDITSAQSEAWGGGRHEKKILVLYLYSFKIKSLERLTDNADRKKEVKRGSFMVNW